MRPSVRITSAKSYKIFVSSDKAWKASDRISQAMNPPHPHQRSGGLLPGAPGCPDWRAIFWQGYFNIINFSNLNQSAILPTLIYHHSLQTFKLFLKLSPERSLLFLVFYRFERKFIFVCLKQNWETREEVARLLTALGQSASSCLIDCRVLDNTSM